jgi:hypothetical protein
MPDLKCLLDVSSPMHILSAGIGWVEFTTLPYLPSAGGFYTIL